MKPQRKILQLALNKETLKCLNAVVLRSVAGGETVDTDPLFSWEVCPTWDTCYSCISDARVCCA